MIDFTKGFTVDDFHAFEHYMGTIFYKLIKTYNHPIDNVIELAPGHRYKIAWALSQIDFKGNLYVIDSNDKVLEYIQTEYKKLLPNANIIPINQSLMNSISELPKQVDLFLSNHPIDDMVIAEYLNKNNLEIAFDNTENSKNILLKSWEELSNNPTILNEIKNKVFNDWIKFLEQIDVNLIIINQYISGYYVKENNYMENLIRDLFISIKNTVPTNNQLVDDAISFYVKEDEERIKAGGLKLTDNIQNSKNWIVGKYKARQKYYDIPESIDKIHSQTFIEQNLYKRKKELKPIYINKTLFEQIFNIKYEWNIAKKIITDYFSVTINEEYKKDNEMIGKAYIDRQKDPLDIALDGNDGSGRAYYIGDNFNFKGEKTPLATSKYSVYNNGKLSLVSSIQETLISNVLTKDLTPTTYETLAILDCDEEYDFPANDDITERMPSGIMIRYNKENQLYRFSHRFVNEVPYSKDELVNIAKNIGALEGNKFIERLLHGAWSAGNLSIDANMIDFDTTFFVKNRNPQHSFTFRYKTNYFGYEYLGQLKIIESLVNSNLNTDKINYSFLEQIVVVGRASQIAKRFCDLMGFDANIYYKYPKEVIALSQEFEQLSNITYENYDALNVINRECRNTALFDFSTFFRYYLTKNYSIDHYLNLIVNKDYYLNPDTLNSEVKEKIKTNLSKVFINNDEDYFKAINRINEFIENYNNLLNRIKTEQIIDIRKSAIKAYCLNEDRKYLICDERIRYEIAELYKRTNDRYVNEIINLIINFSLRNHINYENHQCNLILFQEFAFYTVINQDTFYFEILPLMQINNTFKLMFNLNEVKLTNIDGRLTSKKYPIEQLLTNTNTINFEYEKELQPIGDKSRMTYYQNNYFVL